MKPINQEEISILQEVISQKRATWEKLDLVKLFKKRESERMKFFSEIAFKADEIKIPIGRIRELIELNVLDYISEVKGDICITAKGSLILKYNLVNLPNSVDDFLNHINEEFYEDIRKKSKTPLNFEEKCAIITLMGLLSFTKKYSIDIQSLREKENDSIDKCFVKVSEFLSSTLGVENLSGYKLTNSDTEGKPAVTFFRRLDNIQLKTESIYVKSGGSHYLDIISNQAIDQWKLSFLLRRIFDKEPLNFEERLALVSLLREIEDDRISILGNLPDFNTNNIRSNLAYNVKDYRS